MSGTGLEGVTVPARPAPHALRPAGFAPVPRMPARPDPRAPSPPAPPRRILSRSTAIGALVPAVTLLNAGIGVLLPALMTPRDFGAYALAVTLFQYGLIFDLGASQLADRDIPALLGRERTLAAARAGQELLWLRLAVAAGTLALGVPALVGLRLLGILPFPLTAGLLSAAAGIAYMVALGPACVWRARSARQPYALAVAALSAGLVFARPLGLVAGGLGGCFAALAAWYVGFAVVLNGRMAPRPALRPDARRLLALAARGLPFFLTSFIWAFYVTGNRWFASAVVPAAEFGEFAFAANVFSLLVGAAGGLSAFYYPSLCERIARGGPWSQSGRLAADCAKLLLACVVVMAAGLVLARPMVALIYPSYVLAVPAARVMLVAVPPLVLASWLMPVSLSSGRHAWVEGVLVFPLATVLLGLAVHGLHALWGTQGAAAASAASAVPLVAMQLAGLWRARILGGRHMALLLAATVLAVVALTALLLASGPA